MFKLALLAMLMSIWLIGKATEPDVAEEQSQVEDALAVRPAITFEPVRQPKRVEPLIDPATPGGVEGFVKFAGKKVARKPIALGSDPYCDKFYAGRELLSEAWVWGENGTVQDVLVHVTAGLPAGKWDAPGHDAMVVLEGCRFSPHVTALRLGQVVAFHSLDRTLHHTTIQPTHSPGLNITQPTPEIVVPWMPERPEIGIPLKCDVHSWMRGYIHVMAHPFHSVTDETGSFKIADLPPGEYELSLWHEVKAFRDSVQPIQVKIEPGRTTQIVFTINPGAK